MESGVCEDAVDPLGRGRGWGLGDGDQVSVEIAQAAGWIGVCRVSGELEGLTAAAAEVDLFAVAVCAGVLHPTLATEAVEGWRVLPEPLEGMGADGVELKAGDDGGGVAWESEAGGVDEHHLASPTADAGFGVAGIVVGKDGLELDAAA